MEIYNININSDINQEFLCLTIGNFDGIHQGHQFVINRLIQESKKLNLKSAVISFYPHPREFFDKNFEQFNILTETHKEEMFKKLGIDVFYKLLFDKNTSLMSPENFVIEFLLNKLKLKSLIIGENFRFGKDRKGDIHLLKKLSIKNNFNLHIITSLKSDLTNDIFSSSIIRNYIKEGKVEKASILLKRPWSIEGIVEKGDKRARKMGFPTANLSPPQTILPKKGVYAVNVMIENIKYSGIANFGKRPTFEGEKILFEVNIFNFNQEIYGKKMKVELITFIRDEKKFNNFEELEQQVQKDVQLAKSYFVKYNKKI